MVLQRDLGYVYGGHGLGRRPTLPRGSRRMHVPVGVSGMALRRSLITAYVQVCLCFPYAWVERPVDGFQKQDKSLCFGEEEVKPQVVQS